MSYTRRLVCSTPTAATDKIFQSARNGGIHSQVTKNTRTICSFPSITRATDTTLNRQRITTTKPQQQQYHSHMSHAQTTARNRLGAANNHVIQYRSMVTITNTKSSDLAPLYSSQVVDDVSSSSSAAPTYAVNEETSLIVTESCLQQIERLLRQRRAKADQPEDYDDGYFLRVFVDAGGCSGFQYQFEVDNEFDEDEDLVVVMAKVPGNDGADANGDENTVLRPRVVVDEASMGFLEGSTIDYVIEMIKSAFVISDNPQSESACGCGSSFALKNFEKFGGKD